MVSADQQENVLKGTQRMVEENLLHTITYNDGAHAHGPWGGHHYQSNMLDANRKVVPVMTSIFTFNESIASSQLHMQCMKECFPKAGGMNTGDWNHVNDGGKGAISALDETMPNSNLQLCSNHTKARVRENCGSAAAAAFDKAVHATVSLPPRPRFATTPRKTQQRGPMRPMSQLG